MHNAIAGGSVGYIGTQRGFLGIPFVDHSFFYRYPRISPPMMGAAVYGGMGWILSTIGGKSL